MIAKARRIRGEEGEGRKRRRERIGEKGNNGERAEGGERTGYERER